MSNAPQSHDPSQFERGAFLTTLVSGPSRGVGKAWIYEFTAATTAVNIVLSGDNAPAGGDRNPILNGLTLEILPSELEP